MNLITNAAEAAGDREGGEVTDRAPGSGRLRLASYLEATVHG